MTDYRIQLSAHRLARQTVYRAQVLQGDVPIATTVNPWPENAGCGRSAAIGDGSRLIAALEYQDLETAPLSQRALKTLQRHPFDSRDWQWLLWGFAAWYLAVAAIGGCR